MLSGFEKSPLHMKTEDNQLIFPRFVQRNKSETLEEPINRNGFWKMYKMIVKKYIFNSFHNYHDQMLPEFLYYSFLQRISKFYGIVLMPALS